jgi:glyoxylate utilization-related uncharacterized protein
MKRALPACAVLAFTIAPSIPEETGGAMVVNSTEAKWTREAGDPPGAESVLLREDSQTGATELFARYPAGHVFRPHWHTANERMVLIEGRLSIGKGNSVKYLEPGGFAYLPAKQVQAMACVSKTSCTFYVYWDGKLDFHRAAANQ